MKDDNIISQKPYLNMQSIIQKHMLKLKNVEGRIVVKKHIYSSHVNYQLQN